MFTTRTQTFEILGNAMKKLITIMASIFSLQASAFQILEYKGRLVTNYQSSDRETAVGYHTLAISEPNGGIQEIAIPASESLRFLKRYSGKDVIFEVGTKEGVALPVALNMAVFLKDTQVTYWKNATENYYEFPQKVAMTETNSENIAGLVKYDGETVSNQASGFVIVTKDKTLKVAKGDRQLTYSLNALRGQVATFTISKIEDSGSSRPPVTIPPFDLPGIDDMFNIPFGNPWNPNHWNPWGPGSHHIPLSSPAKINCTPAEYLKRGMQGAFLTPCPPMMSPAINLSTTSVNPVIEDAVTEPNNGAESESSEEIEKDLISIESIVKPMQIGSVQGVATLDWEDGQYTLEIEMGEDQKINLEYHKDFHDEWSDQSLASSTLKVNYRVVVHANGPYPMVESYEVIKKSDYDEEEDDFVGP